MKIASVFPNLFKIPGTIVSGETLLIDQITNLSLSDVQMLSVEDGERVRYDEKEKIKLYPTIGGYSVLDNILNTYPQDYDKLPWKLCKDLVVWIGATNFDAEFDSIFQVFEATNFGSVIIDRGDETHKLITLNDVVNLMRDEVILSNVTAQEISSRKVTIPKDTPIIDAIKIMFQKRIRRLFLGDSYWNREFVSSKKIIEHLFTPERLEHLKEKPEGWLDGQINDIARSSAEIVPDESSVNKISKLLGPEIEACLLTEKRSQVITRWDLIMKTWKKSEFRIR
jgi:CBS domain-containing protein